MRMWSRAAAWMRLLGVAAGLAAAVSLGCGGGGGDGSGAPAGDSSGQVLIGLTDAEGDFVRYDVGVVSVHLTKANGTEVVAIPIETRVDFAQLTELTEFVTAATVPNGAYRAMTLTLDYKSAEIFVEKDGARVPVQLAGVPADGILELDVELDNRKHLVVAPGVPAYVNLDFNLAATHDVDMGAPDSPPTVTVHPTLVAEVNPEKPKLHRVQGPLVNVNQGERSFTLAVRPFRVHNPKKLGDLEVLTSAETAYEVDGVSAAGDAGFALLAAKPSGTAVFAVGDLEPAGRTFRAREVYAGSSVPGGTRDDLTGTVIARNGLSLTVRGATLDRTDGALFLNQDVTVTLTGQTRVTRQGRVGESLPVNAVSVGQRIVAGGTYDSKTATLAAEHVRLLVTAAAGTVVAKRSGELDLELQHIDGRRGDLFDFSGTGATPGDDADPTAYTVKTGILTLSSVAAGDPVRVLGFVTAFGAAPPDFEAVSIADASEAVAHLTVGWLPSATNPLTVDADANTLTLNLGSSPVHEVARAGIRIELTAQPAPKVVPENPERGLFALHQKKGPTAVYSRYGDFEEALQGELAQGGRLASLTALGSFAPQPQAFAAREIVVRIR